MEIHESVSRLAAAFNLPERRAGVYTSELAAAGVDASRLEDAVGFIIRNLDRCPSIAELVRRCAASGEGAKQLSEQETRDLITRRLRYINPNRPVTEERIRLHREQFAEEFSGRFAHDASQAAPRRATGSEEDARIGRMIFGLYRAGIVWDHHRNRWTEPGEKPTPMTRTERDAMRFRGWRPPMPAWDAIVARFEQMKSDEAILVNQVVVAEPEPIEEIPF